MNSPWTRVVLCASAMLLAACAAAPSASAPPIVPDAPSSDVARLAATLQSDEFDAPSPVSIAEAQKAAAGVSHEDHGESETAAASPADPHAGHREAASPPPDPHAGHGAAASSPPQAKTKATPSRPRAAATRPAEQTVYTCPMHPEVRSGKPGKCPKCGMTLVKAAPKKEK